MAAIAKPTIKNTADWKIIVNERRSSIVPVPEAWVIFLNGPMPPNYLNYHRREGGIELPFLFNDENDIVLAIIDDFTPFRLLA